MVLVCAVAVQSACRSSSGENALYEGIDLVCPWEEVSSVSSYTILDSFPHSLFLTRIMYQLNMAIFFFSCLFLISDLKYTQMHLYIWQIVA